MCWLGFKIVFLWILGEDLVIGFFTQFCGVNPLIIGLQYHFGGIAIVGQNHRSTGQRLFGVTIGDDTANGNNNRSDIKRVNIVVVLFVATVTTKETFVGIALHESDTEVVTP